MVRIVLKGTYADQGSLISLIKWHNRAIRLVDLVQAIRLKLSAADFYCEMAT